MIALLVTVKSGQNMPSVNTFGGCDPFVEVRCVKGDPSEQNGDVKATPKEGTAGQTKEIKGEANPAWNSTFSLNKCTLEKDSFVNILLWDHGQGLPGMSGQSGNTAIGYQRLPLSTLLDGMSYNASLAELPKKDFAAAAFQCLLETPPQGFFPGVNLSFQWCEVHKFTFHIESCSNLPKTCQDCFIEVRNVEKDPRNEKYPITGKNCTWTAKTKTITDNTNPVFDQELEGFCPADPTDWFQITIIDSGRGLMAKQTPLGHVVVSMRGLCGQKNGSKEFISMPVKLPNFSEPDGLGDCRIKFKIVHDRASTLA